MAILTSNWSMVCGAIASATKTMPKMEVQAPPTKNEETMSQRGGAVRALCTRCAKSWPYSTTGSSVSSKDWKDVIEWLPQWTGL